ncbi:hypothetical protein SAMN05216573_103513 [Bradyrhizobium sp. Rc3b]|uniref:hypothetical protein n=1 Tax=unclassified Bradyrhizobium TaxID=2631580 RepID=UPI0008EFEE10|nr:MULTISPECIES: hypothetical protein [unclassified Bradyrhizobium]MBB4377750.1 threonine/homoserine/homoserine lactone efflux protein [Bradyrhizobium sp. SBR1B]SFM69221.1 hypothetical protein SAMN05216573_103513 [Bradyrhizobium sp. Rc3b]
MSFLTFFTATYFLLAVPGPTNTLLATSGAGIGIARSLHLLVAELAGYLLAIALLRLALGPIVMDIPLAAVLLRVAVTIYILCLAAMLWRVNTRELRDGAAVTFGQVLLTTLAPRGSLWAQRSAAAPAGSGIPTWSRAPARSRLSR